MTRYAIDAEESVVFIDGRSSVHPISTKTKGLSGHLDAAVSEDGVVVAPGARVSFPVDRLRSGNPLEDRELRRRVDAKHYPTIEGELTGMEPGATAGSYRVAGTVTFRGVTRLYEHEMEFVAVDDDTLRISGESTFDVRDFGMEPPKILMLRVEPEVKVRVEIVARREAS